MREYKPFGATNFLQNRLSHKDSISVLDMLLRFVVVLVSLVCNFQLILWPKLDNNVCCLQPKTNTASTFDRSIDTVSCYPCLLGT